MANDLQAVVLLDMAIKFITRSKDGGHRSDLFYPDLENTTCEITQFLCLTGTLEDKWKLEVRPSGMLNRFMQHKNIFRVCDEII